MFEFKTFNSIGGFDDFDSSICYTKHLSPRETGGPVVKTGPTAGQNRSRNKNGRWHKKRSDTDKSRK